MPRHAQSVVQDLPPRYRFDARLSEAQKLLLERAAHLEGCTLSGFVLNAATAAAKNTLERHARLVLSAQESADFAQAVLSPAKPGPVLRKAMRNYRKRVPAH